MIYENIAALAEYAVCNGLIEEEERIYSINLLLDVLHLSEYEDPRDASSEGIQEGSIRFTEGTPKGSICLSKDTQSGSKNLKDDVQKKCECLDEGIPKECLSEESHSLEYLATHLEENLRQILDYAYSQGLIEENTTLYRDLFDTKVMNCFVPRPSTVNAKFWELYKESPEAATDYFYALSKASDYIRTYRIKKDIKWTTDSEFGPIQISINLAKPEKDPKAIAAAGSAKATAYPKCQLCAENEGYAGRVNHPARENHRIVPLTICQEPWGFQYSPYVYYNEHCIVLNKKHVPMTINREVFEKLFDFLRQFPHYTVMTNADLPIVGGSILAHEHFQGGRYDFPMAAAEVEKSFTIPGYEDVEAGIVKWPLSVIRIRCKQQNRLVELADHILKNWRGYTDEEAFIYAFTEEVDGEAAAKTVPHNTITPCARVRDGKFELDLVLRNNITTADRPLGVYHPRPEYFHIKKENIGGIEVMGLAILPSRLKDELALLGEYIVEGKDYRSNEVLAKHADWVDEFLPAYEGKITAETIDGILREETGKVFVKVLMDAGVYKRDEKGREAFMRFIATL